MSKQSEKFLSRPEVLDRIGVSFPTLWHWMKAGKFPPAREMSGNDGKRVGWLESEVNDWIRSRPVRQYGRRSAKHKGKAQASAVAS
jgi:prophage regulatory protein